MALGLGLGLSKNNFMSPLYKKLAKECGLLSYTKPLDDKVNDYNFVKCNSDGTLNPSGDYIKLESAYAEIVSADTNNILIDGGGSPKVLEIASLVNNTSNQFFTNNLAKTGQAVFPLVCGAGLFDFSVNEGNPIWYFADGSISTNLRPTRTLATAQTVYLVVDDFESSTLEIIDNGTNANYIGNLNDFPKITNYANFSNTNVEGDILALSNITNLAIFGNTNVGGDILALSNITNLAIFGNTNVEGDILALSNITNYADFGNTNVEGDILALSNITNLANFGNTNVEGDILALSNITNTAIFSNTNVGGDILALSNITNYANFSNTNVGGDILALSNITNYANFNNTNVSGILNPHENLEYLNLGFTNLSQNDVDQTVINLNNNTVESSGYLNLDGLSRTSASTSAINSLISKGWTVVDASQVV